MTMKKIHRKMLRLLDQEYLIFVEERQYGLEYVGEWPMDEDRHDSLFFNYNEFWVAKREDLDEIRDRKSLDELEDLDKILVIRAGLGVVMYKRDLDLSVATWNLLRIWNMPNADSK